MVDRFNFIVKQASRRKNREYAKHGNSAKYKELNKEVKAKLSDATKNFFNKELLSPLLNAMNSDKDTATSFLLDPSTNPIVIALVQQHGQGPVLGPLFRVSRAWIWSAHRARMRLLGLERFLQY